jgi:serine/threonine-protein kinase
MVDETNPPPIEAGMVFERIDGHGLLREFSGVPYDENPPATPVEVETVFRAAGLDLKTFTEAAPGSIRQMLPRHPADQLRVWQGPHPKVPDTELTVEIATWKGRVTDMRVEFPWYRSADPAAANRSLLWKLRGVFVMLALGAAGFFTILLARANWKKERVDKKGALRIAIACFAFAIVAWAGRMHPIPSDDMFSLFIATAGDALMSGAMIWLLYLALEPAVRSRWPHAIVTWNRVLAGRWNDAQVGSHILIGAALGTGMWAALGIPIDEPKNILNAGLALWPLLGARAWVAAYVINVREALVFGLLQFFTIFGLRTLLKKDWLAAMVAALAFTVFQTDILSDPNWQKQLTIYVTLYLILMFVLVRVGLVTAISAMFFLNALNRVCLGSDWKAWWAPYGLATMALIIGMAAYALWRSIGTRDVAQ